MNAKMKKSLANDALKYAINENDRRGYVPGHDGAVKDAYIAGFEARDRIAQERESKLVEVLEALIYAMSVTKNGLANIGVGNAALNDAITLAEQALANYKAEGE